MHFAFSNNLPHGSIVWENKYTELDTSAHDLSLAAVQASPQQQNYKTEGKKREGAWTAAKVASGSTRTRILDTDLDYRLPTRVGQVRCSEKKKTVNRALNLGVVDQGAVGCSGLPVGGDDVLGDKLPAGAGGEPEREGSLQPLAVVEAPQCTPVMRHPRPRVAAGHLHGDGLEVAIAVRELDQGLEVEGVRALVNPEGDLHARVLAWHPTINRNTKISTDSINTRVIADCRGSYVQKHTSCTGF